MKVPLLDLKLQYQTIKSEVEPAILAIAESQALILGKEVENLEITLAEYCGSGYAIGVSSGTDSLLMALMALDIKPGDEVILPTYSFFATAGVVARLNAIPVFVDSDPVTFNIDPKLIEKEITPRTKAIIPVHLYGQSADMDAILEIANRHNIPVIEDCAQAIGARYSNNKPVGSMGLMGCFSFYPTKNLGGFGDGGLVTTNDKELAIRLKQMRNHGMEPKYYHKFVGGNFRLDAIQAAVLNIKFKYLEEWHEGRRRNAELYNQFFIEKQLAQRTGVTAIDVNNKVLIPEAVYLKSGAKNYHIYNQYIIQVQERDKLRQFLGDNGIGSEIYYPVPFHRQECFDTTNAPDSKFPVANYFSEHSIALPIFPELTEEQIRYVVDKIAEFLG
jgi:dTDP-4-amino-4,6-dideoxygalactose transaminase